jgi:hypothetical protein
MSYIEGNFFPLKVFVRNEYLYQFKKGHGEFTEGVVLTIRCMPGQVVLFQVLLNNGVVRDKLPSHALLTSPELPDPDLPFHYLQLWNSFSYNFTLLAINYLYDTKVSVLMKDGKFYEGSYYATINWGSNDKDADLTLAEDPMEHKSHHIILLDNGQIALQPNNRIKWSEPSFVTKPFPEKPDYLVNKDWFNSEGYDKWATADNDEYLYDINSKENSKEPSKEISKDSSKEIFKEVGKELNKEVSKEIFKEDTKKINLSEPTTWSYRAANGDIIEVTL